MILAGDIGGTKTHLALFFEHSLVREEKFLSKEHASLSLIISKFLSHSNEKPTGACLAIAGPIRDNRCQATNLPWMIDGEVLQKEFNIEHVALINDLQANAYGIFCLKKEELVTIHPGEKSFGNQALISAGTGLGEAGLFWNGKEHLPFPCEGGHVDFAPRNELEMELLRYLQKKFGSHISYERILSGSGLVNLYQFLVDMRLEKEPEWLVDQMRLKDPAQAISEAALGHRAQIAVRAVDWFVSIYGAEAGNLALKFLSLGGLYIGGGIAPKILPFLQKEQFLHAFCAKGRFASLLKTIPVYLILNEKTALLGAIEYMRRSYE